MMHKQNFSDVFFSQTCFEFFFPLEVCKILLYSNCFSNYKPTHELAILPACCTEDGLTWFQAENEFVEYVCRLSTCFCLFLLTVRFLKSVGKFYFYPKKWSTVIEAYSTLKPQKNKIVKIRSESF